MSDKASEQFDPREEETLEDEGLWRGDCGTLSLASRRALLQLVRGPLINAETNRELWQALFHDRAIITSRLCDLCLTLVINEEDGIAFVQNAPTQDAHIPKAVRNQPLTLIDTILVLTLRRDLIIGRAGRVFTGREEAFGAVAQYRPLAKLDESAFQKRLEASWGKLISAGILLKTDLDERYEISPVLKLIFGADEADTINALFDAMLENPDQAAGAQESEG
ncbi:MAG: DUF4194 domain-containing protein [Raoultibacter sp.]